MNRKLENLFKKNLIKYSLRKSIKISIDGTRDKSRSTYCLGVLSDYYIKKILNLITENEEAKKYILRRTNDSTSLIIGLDSNTVRVYLDSGFVNGKTSMISVEIKQNEMKVKTYKKENYSGQLDDYFMPLTDYLDIDSFVVRSDGQMYFRFYREVPRHVFDYFCRNEPFFDEVSKPVWFQFSENSFTFYFQS